MVLRAFTSIWLLSDVQLDCAKITLEELSFQDERRPWFDSNFNPKQLRGQAAVVRFHSAAVQKGTGATFNVLQVVLTARPRVRRRVISTAFGAINNSSKISL